MPKEWAQFSAHRTPPVDRLNGPRVVWGIFINFLGLDVGDDFFRSAKKIHMSCILTPEHVNNAREFFLVVDGSFLIIIVYGAEWATLVEGKCPA